MQSVNDIFSPMYLWWSWFRWILQQGFPKSKDVVADCSRSINQQNQILHLLTLVSILLTNVRRKCQCWVISISSDEKLQRHTGPVESPSLRPCAHHSQEQATLLLVWKSWLSIQLCLKIPLQTTMSSCIYHLIFSWFILSCCVKFAPYYSIVQNLW